MALPVRASMRLREHRATTHERSSPSGERSGGHAQRQHAKHATESRCNDVGKQAKQASHSSVSCVLQGPSHSRRYLRSALPHLACRDSPLGGFYESKDAAPVAGCSPGGGHPCDWTVVLCRQILLPADKSADQLQGNRYRINVTWFPGHAPGGA